MPGHLTNDGFEHFVSDAEGILAWVRTTEPAPSRGEVLAHGRFLIQNGLIEPGEVDRLIRAGYRELRVETRSG